MPGSAGLSDHNPMILKLRACPFWNRTSGVTASAHHRPQRPKRLSVAALRDPPVADTFAQIVYNNVCDSGSGWRFPSLPQHFRSAGGAILEPVDHHRPDGRHGHSAEL